MAYVSQFTKDMDIIAKLPDEPSDIEYTADELKAKFDEGGNAIKEYLNGTLKSYVDLLRRDVDDISQGGLATSAVKTIHIADAVSGDSSVGISTAKLQDNSVTNAKIVSLSATKLTGVVPLASIPDVSTKVTALDASLLTGTISNDRLSTIPVAKLSGTLAVSQVPALDASYIASGTLDSARIPTYYELKHGKSAVTITSSAWTESSDVWTATVSCSFLDPNLDQLVTAAPASVTTWGEIGGYASSVTSGSITFTAVNEPETDVTINILQMGG